MKVIQVLDTQGNALHTTYERRALGLVKKGRAYKVDASTICLLCPANKTEEKIMENITNQDILTRLDAIIQHSEYLHDAFMTFEKMPMNMDCETSKDRVAAIKEMVIAREKTNQEVLQVLKVMQKGIDTKEETVE